jgi:hypothetical protein
MTTSLTIPRGKEFEPQGRANAEREDGENAMLTKKELAARLKVTVRTVENWQRAGLLPYLKISSVILFDWREVREHLNTNFKVCRRGSVRLRNDR